MPRWKPTEDRGLFAVAGLVNKMGWIFRDHRQADVGIDAQIEIVEGEPTGRLIACQIRSGESYFEESSATHIVFREDSTHLDYWLNHALPVIIVLYSGAEDKAYWAAVTEDAIVRTGKGWRLEVPRSQQLGLGAREALLELANAEGPLVRLRKLWADCELMEAVAAADPPVRLSFVAKLDSINPHGDVRLVRGSGKDEEVLASYWIPSFPAAEELSDFLAQLFPWALLEHEDDGEESEELIQEWHDERYGIYAEGELITHEQDVSVSMLEFQGLGSLGVRQRLAELRSEKMWGLELDLGLNTLGSSFLVVDSFLNEEEPEPDPVR